MNKNILIKSLAALTILTSVGISEISSNEFQLVAKAEHNVKEIKDASVAPYNSVVAFKTATGFVVGKNTIVTNKHVVKRYKAGDRISAHPTGYTSNGGIYTIKDIILYPGNEDLAIVHVHEKSDEGFNFNEKVKALPIAAKAEKNERISVVGYPDLINKGYKLMESTGKVVEIQGNIMNMDAYVEHGNSGSPVLNSNKEAIGVIYAKRGGTIGSEESIGVYFTQQIKDFIQANIEK